METSDARKRHTESTENVRAPMPCWACGDACLPGEKLCTACTRMAGIQREADNQARVGDPVNHPAHYTSHPSGVECIDVTEHYGFSIGNAIKYLWRAGLKGDAIEDLRKARWYVDREIARLEKAAGR